MFVRSNPLHRAVGMSLLVLLMLPLGSEAAIDFKFRRKGEKEVSRRCVDSNAWPAYLLDEAGDPMAIRDTFNTQSDTDWMGLRFARYDGPKIRLGVFKVENKSAQAASGLGGGRIEVPVAGIEELLTSALYGTGRFDMIERKRVDLVLKEQGRKEAVEPSPRQLFEAGQVLGVQYLVYGTVNEWVPDRGVKRGGIKGVLGKKTEAEVAISFTLADITSAKIQFTTTERARVGEWSLAFSDGKGGSGASDSKTPVNYALQACVNKAAFKIMMFLRNEKWAGAVVNIEGADLFVNAGSDQGLRPGMLLTLFARKGPVYDRNRFLGEHLVANGTLEVITAQNSFSIARVQEGGKGVKKYDRVELTEPPQLPAIPRDCAEALPVTL